MGLGPRAIASIGAALAFLTVAGCTSSQTSHGASSSSSSMPTAAAATSATVQISQETFTVALPGVATLTGYVSYTATQSRSVTLRAVDPATPDVAGFKAAGKGVEMTFSGTPLGTPLTIDFPVGSAPQGALPVVVSQLTGGGYLVEPAAASSDGITFQTLDLTKKWPGWLMPAEYVSPLIAMFTDTLTATDPSAACTSPDSSWAMVTPDTSLLRTCLTTSGTTAHLRLTTQPNLFTDLTYPGVAHPRKLSIDAEHKLMTRASNEGDPSFGITLPPGTTVSGDFARKNKPVDQRFLAQVTPSMEVMSDSYALLTAIGLTQEEAEWATIWGMDKGCALLPDQHAASDEVNQLRQFADTKSLAEAVTCTVEKLAALADGSKADAAATRLLQTLKVPFGTQATLTQTLTSAAQHVQLAAYALQKVPAADMARAVAQQTLSSFPNLGANDPVYVHLNLPGSQGQYLYDWSDTGGVAFMAPSSYGIPCIMAGSDVSLLGFRHYVRCDGKPPSSSTLPPIPKDICTMHSVNGATLTTTPQVLCSGGSIGWILKPKPKPNKTPWYPTDWYDPAHNQYPAHPRWLTLAVGNSIRVDDQLCTAIPGGVRCKNTQTGHGFSITTTTYRFF